MECASETLTDHNGIEASFKLISAEYINDNAGIIRIH